MFALKESNKQTQQYFITSSSTRGERDDGQHHNVEFVSDEDVTTLVDSTLSHFANAVVNLFSHQGALSHGAQKKKTEVQRQQALGYLPVLQEIWVLQCQFG